MSDESIENKQKYLREKILEKGHDAEAFMGYCEENYGHIDLEGWSYGKLKDIVRGFLDDKAEKTFTQQQLDDDNGEQIREYEEVHELPGHLPVI